MKHYGWGFATFGCRYISPAETTFTLLPMSIQFQIVIITYCTRTNLFLWAFSQTRENVTQLIMECGTRMTYAIFLHWRSLGLSIHLFVHFFLVRHIHSRSVSRMPWSIWAKTSTKMLSNVNLYHPLREIKEEFDSKLSRQLEHHIICIVASYSVVHSQGKNTHSRNSLSENWNQWRSKTIWDT